MERKDGLDLDACEARFTNWRMDGAEDIGAMGLALVARVRELEAERAPLLAVAKAAARWRNSDGSRTLRHVTKDREALDAALSALRGGAR